MAHRQLLVSIYENAEGVVHSFQLVDILHAQLVIVFKIALPKANTGIQFKEDIIFHFADHLIEHLNSPVEILAKIGQQGFVVNHHIGI